MARSPRIFTAIACAAALAAVGTSEAFAVPLPPGGFVPLTGTTVAARPELAGTVLVDNIVPFTLGNLQGNLQVRVIRETAAGTLDFAYGIRDLSSIDPAGTNDQIIATSHGGFDGWATDVDYRTDGLGTVGPTLGARIGAPLPPGVQFVFFDPVGLDNVDPSDPLASYFYFIKTEATDYGPSSTKLVSLNGISPQTFTVPSYAPVPVPPALWLLGSALTLLGLTSRRSEQG
jgi:hypothetical protein